MDQGARYREARERDDRIVMRSNRRCPHGGRFLTCGHPSCLRARANLLRQASDRGERE